jgi:hypothetical protein
VPHQLLNDAFGDDSSCHRGVSSEG